MFFVISGYLISRIIFLELEAESFSFFRFYQKRILRIFPALMLLLAVVYVILFYPACEKNNTKILGNGFPHFVTQSLLASG